MSDVVGTLPNAFENAYMALSNLSVILDRAGFKDKAAQVAGASSMIRDDWMPACLGLDETFGKTNSCGETA